MTHGNSRCEKVAVCECIQCDPWTIHNLLRGKGRGLLMLVNHAGSANRDAMGTGQDAMSVQTRTLSASIEMLQSLLSKSWIDSPFNGSKLGLLKWNPCFLHSCPMFRNRTSPHLPPPERRLSLTRPAFVLQLGTMTCHSIVYRRHPQHYEDRRPQRAHHCTMTVLMAWYLSHSRMRRLLESLVTHQPSGHQFLLKMDR